MASTQASAEPIENRSPGALHLVRGGLVALAGACVANVVVLFVALATIELPSEFVGGPFGPLAAGPVVVNSTVAAVGATLVYGVVTRRSARPNRTFVAIAVVALVLSFAMFLAPGVAGAPLSVFAVLAVMHVAAAVVIVGVLTRVPRREVASR